MGTVREIAIEKTMAETREGIMDVALAVDTAIAALKGGMRAMIANDAAAF